MPRWIRKGKVVTVPPHHKFGEFGVSEARTAGVMTMRQQIERLQAASFVQGEWKRAHFPAGAEVPDNFMPPAYNPTRLELLDEAKRVLNGKAATRAEARKQMDDEKVAASQLVVPETPADPVEPPEGA